MSVLPAMTAASIAAATTQDRLTAPRSASVRSTRGDRQAIDHGDVVRWQGKRPVDVDTGEPGTTVVRHEDLHHRRHVDRRHAVPVRRRPVRHHRIRSCREQSRPQLRVQSSANCDGRVHLSVPAHEPANTDLVLDCRERNASAFSFVAMERTGLVARQFV